MWMVRPCPANDVECLVWGWASLHEKDGARIHQSDLTRTTTYPNPALTLSQQRPSSASAASYSNGPSVPVFWNIHSYMHARSRLPKIYECIPVSMYVSLIYYFLRHLSRFVAYACYWLLSPSTILFRKVSLLYATLNTVSGSMPDVVGVGVDGVSPRYERSSRLLPGVLCCARTPLAVLNLEILEEHTRAHGLG
jgi:hypothetical protein